MDDVSDRRDRRPNPVDPREPVDPAPPTLFEQTDVFEALVHPRRRLVCALLSMRSEWELDDLAVAIAGREVATIEGTDDRDAIDVGRRRDEVRLSLMHHHLPTLAERDVIAYDERRGTVARTRRATVLQSVLAGIAAVLGAADDPATGPTDE